MHEKALPRGSRKLLDQLESTDPSWLRRWVLAGGTGLALHFGHRCSEDFDFFTAGKQDVRDLHQIFKRIGPYETLQESHNTLTVLARKTKVSFFSISDPFIYPTYSWRSFQVAHVMDIALMKLIAIGGRGSRKDFVDLYAILKHGATLQECFDALPDKYDPSRINTYHLLKSLTYFEDAEQEPMPTMLEPFDWNACKTHFTRAASSLVLP
jgi:hypothetical protein